ncbi:hypothetical protein GCM10009736_00190 [Actinomadura bangladeshensis]
MSEALSIPLVQRGRPAALPEPAAPGVPPLLLAPPPGVPVPGPGASAAGADVPARVGAVPPLDDAWPPFEPDPHPASAAVAAVAASVPQISRCMARPLVRSDDGAGPWPSGRGVVTGPCPGPPPAAAWRPRPALSPPSHFWWYIR